MVNFVSEIESAVKTVYPTVFCYGSTECKIASRGVNWITISNWITTSRVNWITISDWITTSRVNWITTSRDLYTTVSI